MRVDKYGIIFDREIGLESGLGGSDIWPEILMKEVLREGAMQVI